MQRSGCIGQSMTGSPTRNVWEFGKAHSSSNVRRLFRGLATVAGLSALYASGATTEPAPSTSPALPFVHEMPAPEPRRLRQPVHEYFTVSSPQTEGRQAAAARVNPFVTYTHLGTDFGFIGPAQDEIGWEVGSVSVKMGPGQWGGMWHALGGLGMEAQHTLDFDACYASYIAKSYQPRIVGVEFRAKGKGTFKIEIKSAKQTTLWAKTLTVDSPDIRTVTADLDRASISGAKFLNWVAEPGTDASLDSLSFIVQAPAIAYDEYVFLASYAKLARCYSAETGLVKDRAHVRAGYFDNIPSSGMFALASAAAARAGMIQPEMARDMIRHIHASVSRIDTADGLLPHFVKQNKEGVYVILPGTEYSTVDTSIYYHGMLLAAAMMQDADTSRELAQRVSQISLGKMLTEDGYVRHGVRSDKTTPLPGVWRDWGGESALVLAMAAMTSHPIAGKMHKSGYAYDGTGFIPEIQSLFYSDFNSSRLDAISEQNWWAARQTMLIRQKEYFPQNWPDSRVAKLGLYGLSAGEGRLGVGYMVSGVDLPQQRYLHPHYVLMSGALESRVDDVYDILRRMEQEQFFPPWGMVENVNKDGDEYLAMQGSLNAAFETLGAYHLLAKHRGTPNAIYETANREPLMRKGAALFYPSLPTAVADSRVSNPLTSR